MRKCIKTDLQNSYSLLLLSTSWIIHFIFNGSSLAQMTNPKHYLPKMLGEYATTIMSPTFTPKTSISWSWKNDAISSDRFTEHRRQVDVLSVSWWLRWYLGCRYLSVPLAPRDSGLSLAESTVKRLRAMGPLSPSAWGSTQSSVWSHRHPSGRRCTLPTKVLISSTVVPRVHRWDTLLCIGLFLWMVLSRCFQKPVNAVNQGAKTQHRCPSIP